MGDVAGADEEIKEAENMRDIIMNSILGITNPKENIEEGAVQYMREVNDGSHPCNINCVSKRKLIMI